MGYGGYSYVPDILHPEFCRFLDYWKSLVPEDGTPPSRREFDLLELPDLAPRILILEDIEQEGKIRTRYRYFGSKHREIIGRELTGLYLDEVWDRQSLDESNQLYALIREIREPHFWKRHVEYSDAIVIGYERLICPLCNNGETVDMMIGLWRYFGDQTIADKTKENILKIRQADDRTI
jgi:hypothetical protein